MGFKVLVGEESFFQVIRCPLGTAPYTRCDHARNSETLDSLQAGGLSRSLCLYAFIMC